jgi:hypothetical protein
LTQPLLSSKMENIAKKERKRHKKAGRGIYSGGKRDES